MENRRNSGENERLSAARLRALGDIGACLEASGDPLKGLKTVLPAILEQIGGNCDGAVLEPLETVSLNPSAGSWGLLLPIIAHDVGSEAEQLTIAALGIRRKGGAEAVAALPFSAADRAFVEAVAQLAGYCCTEVALRAELLRRDRVAQDLILATELQRSLQPGCDPNALPIWGVNLPARQVSGDFFDFYATDDGDYVFALGDVSGKGMSAALLMAKTIGLFHCLSKRIESPAELLAAINTELCETASRGMFVTMVAGRYSTRDGSVTFANAGHEPPLLRRKDRNYETFPADAPPLGILAGNAFGDEKVVLDGGEFYVFSDGLTEYRYASGEQLGVDGLIQIVEAHAAAPPAERLESLIRMLDEEAGWEARDDLTAIAIDDSWVAGGKIDMEAAG
ncbi:MAG: serine/threonine-protein phosphatase [Rhodospirillaceae bacterium]|jgi:sigma-B regulation protein RsbU (phosphoserine phosphatase)|nr:serine/threonine-protein phosphatase [Rhodospirillaceae bacterium]MBT5455437.1 serine/threonine-protein phosphatase [Rhodospirillaceae bacterium]